MQNNPDAHAPGFVFYTGVLYSWQMQPVEERMKNVIKAIEAHAPTAATFFGAALLIAWCVTRTHPALAYLGTACFALGMANIATRAIEQIASCCFSWYVARKRGGVSMSGTTVFGFGLACVSAGAVAGATAVAPTWYEATPALVYGGVFFVFGLIFMVIGTYDRLPPIGQRGAGG